MNGSELIANTQSFVHSLQMMNSLGQILQRATIWLETEAAKGENTHQEHVLNRFREFLESISGSAAPQKLEIACGLISHWIVDQLDWSGPICTAISAHIEQVRQYAKDEAWRRYKLSATNSRSSPRA